MIYEFSYEEYNKIERQLEVCNKKFAIFSEYEAIDYEPTTDSCLLIRIKEPNSKLARLKHKKDYKDILTVSFEDIPFESEKYITFNEKIAKSIIRKINSNDYKEIIVHCKAGISRSSAVMIGIAKILNMSQLEDFIINSGHFIPNELVLKVFGGLLNEKRE